jgi:hypothetical protein
MSPAQRNVHSTLVRVGARAWGIATGLIFGGGLFVATLVLVLKGGADKGQHLGRLSRVLPGYDITFGGACVGFVYAFVIGYALGRLLAPRKQVTLDALPVSRGKHVRIAGSSWALATGALLAFVLFAVTIVLTARGGANVGTLLNNLAIYFPGYEVTFPGAFIGGAYVFGVGYLLGRLIGAVYNRAVEIAER